tara:strand:+ start:452 stop:928 length:477 start_codon:yes stop_codon:yes gene_type:complete
MKNKKYKNLNIFRNLFITGTSLFLINFANAQGVSNHLLPIKENLSSSKSDIDKFLPMPIGDIKEASRKVDFDRNPFQIPLSNDLSSGNIYENIQFKGLAKSNNKVLAIIQSKQKQGFYKVGDLLDNGYFIKSISTKNISVDISDGSKNYRLSLTNIKN